VCAAHDLHFSLDVLLDLTLQVTLDLDVLVDVGPDLVDLLIGQIPSSGALVDAGHLANLLSCGPANAEHIGERDDETLFAWDVYAGNTCHGFSLASACGGDWMSR
jgi:hypothetical protein